MNRKFYVYIMTNWSNKVFYIGITSDLKWRVFEHKHKLIKGFTNKYNVNKLVYYEEFQYVEDAILREKKIKNWHRQWKINQIKKDNNDFIDLSSEWYDK